jgi:putative superfamily III holin-X
MATRLPDDLKEQPWVDVLKTLGEELRSFIQQEMQLVKVELGSKIKQAGIGAGMFGAAGFMGFLAVGALTAAAILALALVVPAWAASLIVAAFYGLVAALLALSGKKKVQAATPLAPEQAIRTVQAAREQVQQAWERGSHQVSEPGNKAEGWTAGETPGATASGPSDASGPPEGVTNERPTSPIRTTPFRTSPPRY